MHPRELHQNWKIKGNKMTIEELVSRVELMESDLARLKNSQWREWESNETLMKEFKAIQVYAKYKGLYGSKLPTKYLIDYGLYSGDRLVELVEVRCRNAKSTDYETAIVALDKVTNGKFLARTAGVPFTLLVQWSDRIGFTQDFTHPECKLGGWVVKEKETDQEPMYHIPMSSFVFLL